MAAKKKGRSTGAKKKSSSRRTSAKKSSSRRSITARTKRASSSRSGSARKKSRSRRKYGSKAQEEVGTEMRHLKQGEHKNRKQAIAIGLSKARRAGARVPPKKAA